MNTKQKNLQYKTLTINLCKGKFGEYRYKSPRYGYKRAYHHDLAIVILEHDRILARMYTKYWTRKDIQSYLEGVYQFTLTTNFDNMVELYKKAKSLEIDYGYVRDLRNRCLQDLAKTKGL